MIDCWIVIFSGYGGVYSGMAVEAEAMNAAKQASKMAVDIFNDESLDGIAATRGERKAVYVPTFFTNVPQAEAHPVAAAHAESNRFSRDAQVMLWSGHNETLKMNFYCYNIYIFIIFIY